MEVRFFHEAPVLGCVQQILYIQLLIETVKKQPVLFPLVVKWYNSRLITGHYKFDSCREDQFCRSSSLGGQRIVYPIKASSILVYGAKFIDQLTVIRAQNAR